MQASGAKRKLLHVPKYDKWDQVSLEYRVAWPLHLLLTPQVQLVNTLTDIVTNAGVTQILTFAAASHRRCPMAYQLMHIVNLVVVVVKTVYSACNA